MPNDPSESKLEKQMRQIEWLNAYAEMPTVFAANRKTNTTRDTFRKWMEDPEFRQMKDDAEADYNDRLNERMMTIALGMDRKPVISKEGKQVFVTLDGSTHEPAYEVYRNETITMAVAKSRMPVLYADAPAIDVNNLPQDELIKLHKALNVTA